MTARTPRQLADACYALARSTTHAGEREAAIGRGDAIVARHGLDPESFAVPGRARRQCREAPQARTFEVNIFGGSSAEFAAGMARLKRALEEAGLRAGADESETPYDARRRNFEAAEADARRRDRAREARG